MVIDGTAWERPDQKRGPDSNGREERLIPHDIKYFFLYVFSLQGLILNATEQF